MKRLALATAALSLVVAAPAAAAPTSVTVGDFFFKKNYIQVNPGDTVTWVNRGETAHTVTSRSGSPERYDSGTLEAGTTFARAFTKPGQYRYLCDLHPFQMSGVVQVGPDTVKPKVSGAKAKTSSKRVKLSFRLSENAKLVVKLKRGSKTLKTFRTSTLDQGSRTLSYSSKKTLAAGRYKATFGATDQAGNKGTATSLSFKVK